MIRPENTNDGVTNGTDTCSAATTTAGVWKISSCCPHSDHSTGAVSVVPLRTTTDAGHGTLNVENSNLTWPCFGSTQPQRRRHKLGPAHAVPAQPGPPLYRNSRKYALSRHVVRGGAIRQRQRTGGKCRESHTGSV